MTTVPATTTEGEGGQVLATRHAQLLEAKGEER
jgi:hypothetical protein